MTPEAFMNPNMGVLPFEMFRSFAPVFAKHGPLMPWRPPCDIFETEKEIVLKMELPEMRREQIRVTFENNVLTLRGERKLEETVSPENFHCIERKYGEFMRVFSMPALVEGSKVAASFREGVLTLKLPKNAAPTAAPVVVKVL
ncbi:MAG TPA: Hsp20/alpha crystallin family protein [Pyrinomonadaceae bacterium]|nr:Hsp20/alpha crystallin family protein [Pyrinomonadaceae bacterium]